MKRIVLLSTKGGTGKTTLSANIAGILARVNQKVLMIDVDLRQPTLSDYFKIKSQGELGIDHFLRSNDWRKAICKTQFSNLDIVVSNDDTGELEGFISRNPAGRLLLHKKLDIVAKSKYYDYIIIDSWGSTGAVTEMATLAAKDYTLCPTLPEKLSAYELLRNTLGLFDELEDLATFGGLSIAKPQIIFNSVTRTRDAYQIISYLENHYHDKVSFVPVRIPRRTAFTVAASHHVSVDAIETPREIRKDNSATAAICNLIIELDSTLAPIIYRQILKVAA